MGLGGGTSWRWWDGVIKGRGGVHRVGVEQMGGWWRDTERGMIGKEGSFPNNPSGSQQQSG